MAKSNWMKDENQKGNFSNNQEDTFDPGKNYVGIRLQQGVPLLDRDWNELEDIRRYAGVMLRKYFIGNGVPDENSFKITAADPPVNDFKIAAGRCLVEGFEAINDPVDPEGNKLGFILYSQQEGILPLNVPDADRTDTVYLDVWIEEVSGANEPTLKNPQDVDMETCIRHKLEWRVRVNEGSQGYQKEPYHYYYDIARIHRKAKKEKIDDTDSSAKIEDLRVIGLVLHRLTDRSNADDKHKHSRLAAPDGSPDPALVVDNNANVGIGETNPIDRLVVGGVKSPVIRMKSTDGSTGFIQTLHEHGGVRLYDGKEYTMHWKDNKVGIGTPNPEGTLHVKAHSNGWEGGLTLTSQDNIGKWWIHPENTLDHALMLSDNGKTLVIFRNGNVGIGTQSPGAKLHVVGDGPSREEVVLENYGETDIRFRDTKDNQDWQVGTNVHGFYIYNNAYRLVVKKGGNVGIGTMEPKTKLDVDGDISGKSYRNVSQSFFVGGDGDKFYAVAFLDDDWGEGPAEFQVSRSSVHTDRSWWGAMNLTINWHAYCWGHAANFLDQRYHYSQRTFVKDTKEYPYNPYLLVWLRGDTTYYYRSLNNRVVLYEILGTNNQPCSFDPVGYTGYSTAMDCTYRPGGCIPAGTTISGDFYVNGKSHASSLSGPGIDYAEYFESKNGKEIKPGTSVVLEGDKIRPAKKAEIPIGIISANSLIVGGVPLEWPQKYLRDEFGNQIMEEYKEEIVVPKKMKVKKERQKVDKKKVKEKVKRTKVVKKKGKHCRVEVEETVEREIEEPVFKEVDLYDAKGKNKIGKHKIPVMEIYEEEIDVLDDNGQPVMVGSGKFATKTRPKINPDYDETKEYIPREKRPEWNCVGLLGQLPLRKGQPVALTWIKIKDISKDVELWLVK